MSQSSRLPFILLLICFAGSVLNCERVCAQAEITYPATAAERSRNVVAPDGRHWVANLSGGNPSTPVEFTVLRQVSDQPPDPWVEVARFSAGFQPFPEFRLKAGKSTIWLAWQDQPVTGTRKIQIRQVYPTVGAIETVTGSEDQSAGFDLAVDGSDRPCVVSYKTNTDSTPNLIPHIRLHRRGITGEWEHIMVATYQEEIIAKPEQVAIATTGTTIHVYDVSWAQITFSGVALRSSTLYHTEILALGPLSTSQSITYQVASETSNISQGLLPAIANVSAAAGPDGMPAISYSHLGSKQVKYAYKNTGSGWAVETLPQLSGTITTEFLDETTVAIDPSGRPVVVWRSSSAGDLSRSIRYTGGLWSTKSAYGVRMTKPSFCLDQNGNPHYAGGEISAPNRVMAVRPKDITDEDGNGFSALLEEALVMSPGSRINAPEQGVVRIEGRRYATLGYHFTADSPSPPTNPMIEGGLRYTVEISRDLLSWSSASSALVHYNTSTEATDENFIIWRSTVSLEDDPQQFFRIRVNRME